MGERGLLALYNRDGEFQFWIHQIFGLAYVPQQHIIPLYEKVILTYLDKHSPEWEDQAEKIESFRLYLESTYIGREARSAEGQGGNVRKPPLFAHEFWSKYEETMNSVASTNNYSEGLNNAWTLSMEKSASVWAVIKGLTREEDLATTKMRELARGVDQNDRPSKKSKKIARREELISLCKSFTSIPNEDYLKQAAQFF
jgi:hypothetical protein